MCRCQGRRSCILGTPRWNLTQQHSWHRTPFEVLLGHKDGDFSVGTGCAGWSQGLATPKRLHQPVRHSTRNGIKSGVGAPDGQIMGGGPGQRPHVGIVPIPPLWRMEQTGW